MGKILLVTLSVPNLIRKSPIYGTRRIITVRLYPTKERT